MNANSSRFFPGCSNSQIVTKCLRILIQNSLVEKTGESGKKISPIRTVRGEPNVKFRRISTDRLSKYHYGHKCKEHLVWIVICKRSLYFGTEWYYRLFFVVSISNPISFDIHNYSRIDVDVNAWYNCCIRSYTIEVSHKFAKKSLKEKLDLIAEVFVLFFNCIPGASMLLTM